MLQALLAFLLAAALLTVTPGLDTALVLRTAAVGGPRPAALAAIGIGMGCMVWGVAAALGVAALLAASTTAFTVLKIAGAVYLLWLGAKLLFRPRRSFDMGEAPAASSPMAALRRGLLTNLLNPKVGIFYITFLPQFVPAGAPVAAWTVMLAAIHVAISLVWFAALTALTVPLGRVLRRPRVIAWLDRLCGGVFILFGVRLALSRA